MVIFDCTLISALTLDGRPGALSAFLTKSAAGAAHGWVRMGRSFSERAVRSCAEASRGGAARSAASTAAWRAAPDRSEVGGGM